MHCESTISDSCNLACLQDYVLCDQIMFEDDKFTL
jgi:hypothetical protein